MMSPGILLLTLSLAGTPVQGGDASSVAPPAAVTQAAPRAPEPQAAVPEPVADATGSELPEAVQGTEPDAVERVAAPLAPQPVVSEREARNLSLEPRASVVPSRALPVRWAGIGITLVGVGSYIGGQLTMDAADRMPAGPEKKERSDSGRSLRGGGLGAVITGVSIWLISNELARWEDAPLASIGFVPVHDGGAVTFSLRLP